MFFGKPVTLTEETFTQHLRRTDIPLVVDFWAPWCGPCRVLGPILEAEVAAQGGRVELAKVDTDQHPALAAEYGIQGIPAVKAFRNGAVVAQFVGARPATFVRSWLAALSPSPGSSALDRAEGALAAGRRDDAELELRPLLDGEETRDRAALLLARVLVASGKTDEVAAVLGRIDPRSEAAQAIASVERLVAFAADARAGGGEDAARATLRGDPKNLEARYSLASALAARGALAEALEEFLGIVARGRKFKDDGARLAMIAIFEQLGPDHEVAREYRRKLQVVL